MGNILWTTTTNEDKENDAKIDELVDISVQDTIEAKLKIQEQNKDSEYRWVFAKKVMYYQFYLKKKNLARDG